MRKICELQFFADWRDALPRNGPKWDGRAEVGQTEFGCIVPLQDIDLSGYSVLWDKRDKLFSNQYVCDK